MSGISTERAAAHIEAYNMGAQAALIDDEEALEKHCLRFENIYYGDEEAHTWFMAGVNDTLAPVVWINGERL